MKPLNYIRNIAIILAFLIISLPFIYADELNLVTDENGNLITGDSFYREYNELNQLIRIRSGNLSNGQILEEFIWHPTEERILVKDVFSNGVLNYSVYYVNKNYVHIENSSGNYSEKYVYQDNALVAQVTTDGQKQFIHSDHLGSNSLITNASGNIIENSFYSPFGEILNGGGSRYDYNGKEQDTQTKEYDYGARMYKSEWGKFIAPDTLTQYIYEPQFFNHYAYTKNNPYKFIDPNGHVVVYFYGYSTTSSGGSSDLEKLQARETSSQTSILASYNRLDSVKELVKSELQRDKNQPVIIVGHSLGGTSAITLSNSLKEDHIEVDLVVTIDKVGFNNVKPDNVKELINIRQKDGLELHGEEIEGTDEEHILSKIKHTDIDNIDKNPLLGMIPKKADELYGKSGGNGGGGGGSNVECYDSCTKSCDSQGHCSAQTCKTICKLK
ncbi:hypothetical protein HY637_00850 [Candidatus Woesearchaeota archaeon]|nr:hypothetical protein [Candidatus Woesearchaeota archaeon]